MSSESGGQTVQSSPFEGKNKNSLCLSIRIGKLFAETDAGIRFSDYSSDSLMLYLNRII